MMCVYVMSTTLCAFTYTVCIIYVFIRVYVHIYIYMCVCAAWCSDCSDEKRVKDLLVWGYVEAWMCPFHVGNQRHSLIDR